MPTCNSFGSRAVPTSKEMRRACNVGADVIPAAKCQRPVLSRQCQSPTNRLGPSASTWPCTAVKDSVCPATPDQRSVPSRTTILPGRESAAPLALAAPFQGMSNTGVSSSIRCNCTRPCRRARQGNATVIRLALNRGRFVGPRRRPGNMIRSSCFPQCHPGLAARYTGCRRRPAKNSSTA